jgi:hypothetical protein
VISRTSSRFWDAYADRSEEVKRRARKADQLFEENPRHPGLRFKKVHAEAPIYSVRITREYRALGVRDSEAIVWFWIGSHADYERLLTQL